MPVPEVDDRDKAVQKEKQLAETVAAAVVEGNETKLGLDTAAGDPHMRTQPSKRKVRKGIKYQDLKFLPYVIGRGSFGEVKMVQHEKDGSLYALKEIKVGDAEAAKKTIKSELERLQAVFSRVEQAVCLPDLDLSTILNQAMRDFVLQATRSDPAVRPQASDLIRHPFIEDAPDGAGNGLSFLHLLPAYAEASKRLQQRRKQQHEQRERQLRERKAAAGNVKPHRDQAHKDPAAHSPPEPLAMPVFT
eukprot:gene750-1156_t